MNLKMFTILIRIFNFFVISGSDKFRQKISPKLI